MNASCFKAKLKERFDAHFKSRAPSRICQAASDAARGGHAVKIFFVSVPIEFPLASYCLAAQIAAVPETSDIGITILNLDSVRLRDYNRKNAEIWKYIAKIEEEKPDVIAFSAYLWSNLSIRELISITKKVYPG